MNMTMNNTRGIFMAILYWTVLILLLVHPSSDVFLPSNDESTSLPENIILAGEEISGIEDHIAMPDTSGVEGECNHKKYVECCVMRTAEELLYGSLAFKNSDFDLKLGYGLKKQNFINDCSERCFENSFSADLPLVLYTDVI